MQDIGMQFHIHCKEGDVGRYVFRENHGAIRLYSRMGFRVTREIGKTRYIMEWKTQDL